MRTAAGLDADDAFHRQCLHAIEDEFVLLCKDIIGDDADRIAIAHRFAEHFGQRCLAGADRAADTDA